MHKTKELDDNSPSKNDRKDSRIIAGLVRNGRYFYTYMTTGVYAELQNATNRRFVLAEEYELQTGCIEWVNGLIIDQIRYVDRLLEIKGIGITTIARFIVEVGDISRFDHEGSKGSPSWNDPVGCER